jgi:sugar phosphate isomerase/epimerase
MRKYYVSPVMIADAQPLDLVRAARDAGYDGIGLRLQKSPQFPIDPIVGDAALIRDLKKLLGDSNMTVLDIFTFYVQPPGRVADFEPACATAAEFGARYVVMQSNDDDWRRLCDNVAKFHELAGRYGAVPIIEFVPNRRLLTSLPAALKLAEDIGQPDLPILVDPPHLIRSEGKPADICNVAPRRLPYAQMSDAVLAPGEPSLALAQKLGVAQRCMPGDGVLPLRAIFDALPADIDISVEVVTERDPAISPTAWAKEGLMRTKDFFGEA